MRKLLLSGVASALLAAGSAYAADLPTRAPAPAMVVAAYNWSGPYVGINAGGGWLKDDGLNRNGALLGVTVGTNAQTGGPWVWGLEGDIGWFSQNDQKYLGTFRASRLRDRPLDAISDWRLSCYE